MISVDSNISAIGDYIGIVRGSMKAVKTDIYSDYFLDFVLSEVNDRFVAETHAAHDAGKSSLNHVYEWGRKEGETSSIPLWKTVKYGRGNSKALSFVFLESKRNVPLPDPNRYGFNASKVKYLSRHKFRFKAVVMESGQPVTIKRKSAPALFVPTKESSTGYVWLRQPVVVPNPGGRQAAGGFTTWWNEWFASRGEEIVSTEIVPMTERQISNSIERQLGVVRRGSTSRTKEFSVGYVNAAERVAYQRMLADAKMQYNSGEIDEE